MEVKVRNLKKYYKENLVLDIADYTFKEGQIIGLRGPNGVGKSTLLNIIAGLDPQFEGEVLYDGKPLDEKIQKEITEVFQKPFLFKRKVKDNIKYPMLLRKLDKVEIERRTLELAKALEIEDLLNKRGNQLSGGEAQKVALARALVIRPKLLLLDEPTSSIDEEAMITIENCILNFHKQSNATIIIVTHDAIQSDRICDEVVFLERGRIS
ncbi:ABC transporter ATP-binding protein [Soehngenia longivitae]|uniref:ABC transporter ATP-binding protein n=1 Tax=Soehngenia longivitae TaxID=2562294 RepID=A0A4Z0D925_9FIRM|nr:ABC transporter ATP-binding protein [Soehngenia longivitae]TFZ41380.1 ABC transporter ATP-binding protein [Soehngenia longivitae]